jgi:DNA polymerase-3 subunit chi
MHTVRFLKVFSQADKMQAICTMAQRCFDEEKSILFFTASEEAAAYADLLLWRFPPESFLPHIRSESATQETIVITTAAQNINQAKILFNLSPLPAPHWELFPLIYELYDTSHSDKVNAAQQKMSFYNSRSCKVVNT